MDAVWDFPLYRQELDFSNLQLPRSKQLIAAIESNRDFKLLATACGPVESNYGEMLWVSVESDEVPPNNRWGILYREQFAIYVPQDQNKLIEVYPLRKSFPLTPHQNQHGEAHPTSLCLYFEPATSVSRTWTAPKFLHRIQWWLSKTALDQLHAADQPVEQLFFITPYELVLPWDYEEQIKDKSSNFILVSSERFDKKATFLMERADKNSSAKLAGIFNIETPSVVHGIIEKNPETLGGLAAYLSRKGVDFRELLKSYVEDLVPSIGVPLDHDSDYTIVIIRIPICREEGLAPDRFEHKAFMVLKGLLQLGVSLSLLCIHEKKFYKDGLAVKNDQAEIYAEELGVMDVLYHNNIQAFRKYSNTPSNDPKMTLIGVGALGSAMLNIWSRNGWGKWKIIDKDHIKPHNLSRHTALAMHVGMSKTDAACHLYRCVTAGAREIEAVDADANELLCSTSLELMADSEIIIDASTTLEIPRKASELEQLPRHFSVFITPNGNSAVLMAEDDARAFRLRTIEAQYYRAVINSEWGERHLVGSHGAFWSGASCRDISSVLPYADVLVHASTLADQIQQASLSHDPLLRIWNRDPLTGAISVSSIAPLKEFVVTAGDTKIYLDDGVREQLSSLRNSALPNETGGIILGYYDFNINSLVIVCALPAPEDSVSTPTSFDRGVEGLLESVNEASRRTANIVGYVGEWHSHPPESSTNPSKQDIEQMIYLCRNMADEGLPALQIIVGDNELSLIYGAFNYQI